MPTDTQEPIGDGQETETGEEQGQAQDQGGQGVAASAARPETGSDDIALEDDEELDIEIAEVAPRRRSCLAPVVIVLVIAVLVAAALWGKSEWDKKQKELEANEQQTFANVQQSVRDSLGKAAELAKAGKVEEAYKELNTAKDKVATARTAANSNLPGSEDRTKRLLDQATLLGRIIDGIDAHRAELAECDATIADLQAQIAEVKAKRGELEKEISASIKSAAGAPDAGEAAADAGRQSGAPEAGANAAAPAEPTAAQPETAQPAQGKAAEPTAAQPETAQPATAQPAEPAAPTQAKAAGR